ncbi:HSP70-like protein [Leptomonas seymouri]|uniref:HSP70-like protein n=1 Tax=Leptomonas seymouri TaxID=5684 RepID=A0A0N0P5L8_LEPSE|nr:HSP70-like protein [Leptomonas seymouri]|eukprot:KPI86137.1 HSP70-like protein [Leptomonas seymouri]
MKVVTACAFSGAGTRPWYRSLCTLLMMVCVSAVVASASPLLITETELIAIDLGHESMKISAWRTQEEEVSIKSGGVGTVTTTTTAITGAVTMVLNDQTNRKSPPCVAFRYFKAPVGLMVKEDGGNSSEADMSAEALSQPLHPPGYQLERTFAEQAQALAPRFPMQVVCSPAQLIGYTLSSATSSAVGATAPSPHELTEAQQGASGGGARRAHSFKIPFSSSNVTNALNDGCVFTAEELTAMLLGYARRMAEKADAAANALSEDDERQLMDLASSGVAPRGRASLLRGHAVPQYAALTVPMHSNVAQRQALVDAAALAGLRAVRLVHSTTGAAVQLAYMKAEQVLVPGKTQHIMVYDMGSQHVEVAIYGYAAAPSTLAKRDKYQGSVELKALVSNRTLGGAAFDECIAAQWDALYFKSSILTGVRGAATDAERWAATKKRGSLLRAAHKAKEMLSVNQVAHITLDGMHADSALFHSTAQAQLQQHVVAVTADGLLSLRYTRREFEQECTALFKAAVKLRDDAIAATNGVVANVGALDRFEVIGGGTRVPLLLQRLSEGYRVDGTMVDRTLNSDEAAVLGATLLSVSAASNVLPLRGRQSVPRYRVREWLSNAVYVSITAGRTAGDGQVGEDAKAIAEPAEGDVVHLRLLFPAYKTIVPDTHSVRVQLRTDGDQDEEGRNEPQRGEATGAVVGDSVIFTLYSGSEADEAYQARAGASDAEAAGNHNASVSPTDHVVSVPASAAACTSCYVRPYIAHGIKKAKETLKMQVERQYPGGVVALDSAEVVVEAVATVSGIPHFTVAYLRAVYRVTPTSLATAILAPAETTNAPPQEGAEALDEATEKEQASADDTEDTDSEEGQADTQTQQPTTTTTTTTTADAPITSDILEVRAISLPLRHAAAAITTSHRDAITSQQGYNMGRAELQRLKSRVQRLQTMDDVRLQRSTLRNDIESAIIWVREQPAWEAAPPAAAEDVTLSSDPAVSSWRAQVNEIGEWLDDYGETASVAALEERLVAMRVVKRALRARQRGGEAT